VRHDCISTDLHRHLPLSSLARITSRHHRHHHHHIYSPQNTISTSIQESRGRLPERHKHPSMLAALTTKRYNTSTQMHKKHKKESSFWTSEELPETSRHRRSSPQWPHGCNAGLGIVAFLRRRVLWVNIVCRWSKLINYDWEPDLQIRTATEKWSIVWYFIYKSLFTEENGRTRKHSSESINTNKAKTVKTSTKSNTVVDTWNYIIIILHQT